MPQAVIIKNSFQPLCLSDGPEQNIHGRSVENSMAANRASAPCSARDMLKARDRMILYTQCLEIEPLLGLELTLSSLRRTSHTYGAPGIPQAMRELRGLLREQNIGPLLPDDANRVLHSAPPLTNRCRMLVEELDESHSLLRGIAKKLWGKIKIRGKCAGKA